MWVLVNPVDADAILVTEVVGTEVGAAMESARVPGCKASLESCNSTSLPPLFPSTLAFQFSLAGSTLRSAQTSLCSRGALEPHSLAWLLCDSQWDSGHPPTIRFRVTPSPCACLPCFGGTIASTTLPEMPCLIINEWNEWKNEKIIDEKKCDEENKWNEAHTQLTNKLNVNDKQNEILDIKNYSSEQSELNQQKG